MSDDRIRIRQIRVFGHHGVFVDEKTHGQIFEVDVELSVNTRQAGISDALSDTVDYVEVYHIVEHIVSGPSCALMETLAERIAGEIVRVFPVLEAMIRIRKPQVRMPGPVGVIEVEIRRRKA
ncbi:MAG: dihydroneopterin aldolase [candidate division Zixibacteria bacterium]|nr:dihydroneopterin aldolase [candidate division Zixibacteria bacterium]